jgi:hypothetical protein
MLIGKEVVMIADLAMQRALDRYRQAGIAGLTEEERTLATLWYFESRVANGGFEHFFKSREGELANFAPPAFRLVGATRLAKLAERANAVWGTKGVPSDRTDRQRHLAALPGAARTVFEQLDAEYQNYAIDLDAKIEAYFTARHESPGGKPRKVKPG